MFNRLRGLSLLALSALAVFVSANDAKPDYGTVIGIGTFLRLCFYFSLLILGKQTWEQPILLSGTFATSSRLQFAGSTPASQSRV